MLPLRQDLLLSLRIHAPPQEVRELWLDTSRLQAALGAASSEGHPGGRVHVASGPLSGTWERVGASELTMECRFDWREWPAAATSQVHLAFAPDPVGTYATVHHGRIPFPLEERVDRFWRDVYGRICAHVEPNLTGHGWVHHAIPSAPGARPVPG